MFDDDPDGSAGSWEGLKSGSVNPSPKILYSESHLELPILYAVDLHPGASVPSICSRLWCKETLPKDTQHYLQ